MAGDGGGASAFQMSRMYSHFPSFLRDTDRNLPVSTTAPLTVTWYVPDSQPVVPETPTSVFGFNTNTARAFFELAMSFREVVEDGCASLDASYTRRK